MTRRTWLEEETKVGTRCGEVQEFERTATTTCDATTSISSSDIIFAVPPSATSYS